MVVGFFFLLGAVHAAPGKPSFFPFSAKHHRPLEAVESPTALRIFHPRVSMTSTVTRGHEGTTGIGESAPPPQTLVGISPNKLSFGGEGPRRRQLTKSGQIQMRRVRGARGTPIRPALALERSERRACD